MTISKNKKSTLIKTFFYGLLLGLFFISQTTFAQYKIPDKPDFQTSVYDYIGLLESSEKNALEQKLIKYSDTTSTQIVVVIISSTQGENIRYLGARWLEKWGIGDAEKDNGILITLAKDDRKVDINTGYGIEHLLTDALSKRIIELEMIPRFKSSDYYGGLNLGADAICNVLEGEYQGSRKSNPNGFPIGAFIPIIIFFIIILIIISKSRGNNSGGSGGRNSKGLDIWDVIILSNMGRGNYGGRSSSGGFGGWGGSSGGFGGGFGGGMGGGGGASGGW